MSVYQLYFGFPAICRRLLVLYACPAGRPQACVTKPEQSIPAAQERIPYWLWAPAANPCANFLSNSSGVSDPPQRYGIPVTRCPAFQSLRYFLEQDAFRFEELQVQPWFAIAWARATISARDARGRRAIVLA